MDRLWNWLRGKDSLDEDTEDQEINAEHSEDFINGFREGWQTGREFGELETYEELKQTFEDKFHDQLHRIDKNIRRTR